MKYSNTGLSLLSLINPEMAKNYENGNSIKREVCTTKR